MPSEFEQFFTLIPGAVLTALLLALGHWFPWINGLSRMRSYVYGTASLWCGFALWRFLHGDWVTPVGYLVLAAVAGAVVKAAYGWDDITLWRQRAQMAEKVDHDLHE